MDILLVPVLNAPQHGKKHFQCGKTCFGVCLHLLVEVKLIAVLGHFVNEIHLFGDIGEKLGSGLECLYENINVNILTLAGLTDIGKCQSLELVVGKTSEMLGVDSLHLHDIKNCGRLGKSRDIELLYQLIKREYLVLALGRPAQKCDIVDDSGNIEALVNKIAEICVAVTL